MDVERCGSAARFGGGCMRGSSFVRQVVVRWRWMGEQSEPPSSSTSWLFATNFIVLLVGQFIAFVCSSRVRSGHQIQETVIISLSHD